MDVLVSSHQVPGKKVELRKKVYEDGSYFYYLTSIPLSISCGYSGSHNLEQMKLKFNEICKYMDRQWGR